MRKRTKLLSNCVIGPDGYVLTSADLPAPDTKRWVARRKAQVVIAVSSGLLTLAEACGRYGLSSEEFLAWEIAYARKGLSGLRVLPPDHAHLHGSAAR